MWFIVLGLLIGIYLLINYALIDLFGGWAGTYVAQPALWAFLAIVVLGLRRRITAGDEPWLKGRLIKAALAVGVFQIIFLVTAGFFHSFGHSPYSSTSSGIVTNIFYVGSALIGMELTRAYLINSLSGRNNTLVIAFVALLFTVIMIPTSRFTGIGGGEGTVTFLGATCLPLLAQNLLASCLVFLAGPLPAMAYLGSLLAFEWFCPILPDLPPMTTALVGTIAPLMGFLFIQRFLLPEYAEARRPERRRASLGIGWMGVAIISVGIIWFSSGLFPIWPTVIYSGSMSPKLEVGDVVMLTETSPEAIKIGDIIEFRTEDSSFIHRVVDIYDEGGQRLFITKGDANDSPDSDPVLPGQITGKVVFTAPKVGWLVIHIKDLFQ